MSLFCKLVGVLSLLSLFRVAHSLLSSGSSFISNKRTGRTKSITILRGGYDATIGTDPSTPVQFFTTPGNSCPYAARTFIVLKELGVPFDVTEVSVREKPDWYLKINPRGKVPALRVPALNNQVVYESAICCEFLCDAYAPTSLMPTDPMDRATVRLLNDHSDNVLTKSQFTFLINKDVDKDSDLSQALESALMMYEEQLEKSGGPFLMGECFTLADVHILPFILRLVVSLKHYKSYELPAVKFSKLLAWYDVCSQRESVQDAALSEEKIIELYSTYVNR